MKFKKLWETPEESINGCSRIEFNYSQMTVKIIINYKKNGKDAQTTLIFENVIYFRHLGGYFATEEEIKAYEQLIEIEDSEIIAELKSRNSEEVDFWKCKQFSIYTEDDRLFDIVAKSYKII